MMFSQSHSPHPIQYQRAMVFIDGTNLFHRLKSEKLKLVTPLARFCSNFTQGRQLLRTYLYTSPPHFKEAKEIHGEQPFEGTRVVFGEAIQKKDGNYKEKGVDALLVADLVYHAAVKNYDYATLISTDTDFAQALRRVEDFGCKTMVVSLCAQTPDLLRKNADDVMEINKARLIEQYKLCEST